MKFPVVNRFTREAQFEAEIDCDEQATEAVKLGLAVRWAIRHGAYLADGKFRVHRCKIVGEKDLAELGVTPEKEDAA